jgi:hypothetical protein
MRVITRNSIYHLNTIAKTWRRVHKTEKSGNIRTESGTYQGVLHLQIGHSMALIVPPMEADSATSRLLVTSMVENIDVMKDEPTPAEVAWIESQVSGEAQA